jgi:hypothetical protein
LRSVTDDAKNPMEEQTGARTPSASGWSLSTVNIANLIFVWRCQGFQIKIGNIPTPLHLSPRNPMPAGVRRSMPPPP